MPAAITQEIRRVLRETGVDPDKVDVTITRTSTVQITISPRPEVVAKTTTIPPTTEDDEPWDMSR